MFQLTFTLLQDERDHDARNQSQSDRHHESEVERVGCFFTQSELIEDREGYCCRLKLEVWIMVSVRKHRLIHPLWVKSSNVLGSDIEESCNSIALVTTRGLIHLVRTVAVGEEWLLVAYIINFVVELGIVGKVTEIFGFKGM